MGFETAERDCVTSISKVILFAPETPPSLAGSADPSPLAASGAAHVCGRGGGGNVRSVSWEWVLLHLPKKSLFSFNSSSETSNCLEFYAVLLFQLAKGGGGVWKCDELITINLSVTIVTL